MSLGATEILEPLERAAFSDSSRELTREVTPRDLRDLVREHGSPLLVLDCDSVRAQYRRLASALPGVDLHYAMKALSHAAVISTLDAEGSSFDVSSTGEIVLLRKMGIPAARMIHTHPIKRERDIRDAFEFGCRVFVVDNPDEMAKFVDYGESVSLLLRVGFRSSDAAVDLAKKFGCAPEDAFTLLELGNELGLSIFGLSFHVGSQCASSQAHVGAIQGCLDLMTKVRNARLTPIRVLDIGGGFPAAYRPDAPGIEAFCAPIRRALADVPKDIRIIAEPGRYLAASAMESIATVIGKAKRGSSFWYYLDDGVYGSFNQKIYEGARYPLRVVTDSSGERFPSVLAGPTCDGIDILEEGVMLPELRIGDLVAAGAMGAYTIVSASEFNSIPKAKILVLNGAAADAAQDGSEGVADARSSSAAPDIHPARQV